MYTCTDPLNTVQRELIPNLLGLFAFTATEILVNTDFIKLAQVFMFLQVVHFTLLRFSIVNYSSFSRTSPYSMDN